MVKKEKAFGIIAIRRNQNQWETFLVKHCKGHWAFPKGHAEGGEMPRETAAREMEEETGGKVIRFLDIPSLEERYSFQIDNETIDKTVVYFIAEVMNAGSLLQEKEIAEAGWFSFEDAEKRMTFLEAKKVCREAFLKLQMASQI
jgi:8-oxo-dGTP pyrophosphatase MutT (NUDIX family)